ncbi:MAG: exodeoxyribonuclease V subunit gamma [Gammaproteobacteria bacterium]|nr:exodeoxyribonuclease V subunit gamma [Gammaproteobacteria bacterium]
MFNPHLTPLTPGFLVVHANLPEQLRALVVSWTKAYPLAVLETETVLVQSNGIAQWLKLALAADPDPTDPTEGGAGIASGLSLQMPGRFIWQLYRWLLPASDIPEQSGFDKNQLRWRLFRLLPKLAHQDEFQVLQSYLAADEGQRKQQQLAFKLADLFDQYQVYRADWLAAWQQGKDVLLDHRGQATPLPAEQRWQAALWRAIIDDVPPAEQQFSRATLHQNFLQAARAYTMTTRPAGLPRRVIIFGISSLPQQVLEALAAIAPYTQILLAVHNPCQHYWADIIADKDLLKAQHQRQVRKAQMPESLAPEQLQNHAQPLLAAWGKQGRDYIRLLDQFDETQAHLDLFRGQRIDLFSSNDPTHLLAQLQNDILELRPASESAAYWPALNEAQAQSICFATAHSAMREVEILHDDLLAQFAKDPTLKPADVMVMVPDIHLYAAAISAVFGRIARDDPRYIPFTIADQSALQQEPLLQALQLLLQLQTQRFTASTVLDLLQLPAVQRRFGFSGSDIQLLKNWIEAANIRWGLSAAQRESLGLPSGFDDNSWHRGLQRMLLGYAIGQSEPWLGIAPCAQVGGLSAALAGQLSQLLQQLTQAWQQSASRRSPEQWRAWLQQLLADFFEAENEQEQSLLDKLQQTLAEWLDQCQQAGLNDELELSVVSAAWLEGFSAQGLAQRFLAGAVNFATLMPMRAIPFAQIHLLGMNDGDFPRQMIKQDFDLMAANYRPGDRSRRDDDRYLFLEAMLSARQRLRISWVGHSVHDNSERAPSVLVGQLRDHLAAVRRIESKGKILKADAFLDAITVHHPLQPFSRRYVATDSNLMSYQHEWQALHQGVASLKSPEPGVLEAAEQSVVWDLDRLSGWLKDPVKFFFRQRLKVSFETDSLSQQNTENFALDGLERWQLQQRLQQKISKAITAGVPWQQALTQELSLIAAEGLLPVASAATLLSEQFQQLLSPQAEQLQKLVIQYGAPLAQPVWCEFTAGDQQAGDWLRELRPLQADDLPQATDADQPKADFVQLHWLVGALYKDKQLDYRQLLKPWLQQLLAAASGVALQTELVAVDGCMTLPPYSQEPAHRQLQQLFQWLSLSLCRPLPVELGCARLLLQAELAPGNSLDAKLQNQLEKRYQGDGFTPGVLSRNPYLARAFPDFAALWAEGELVSVSIALYQGLRDYLRSAGIAERQ